MSKNDDIISKFKEYYGRVEGLLEERSPDNIVRIRSASPEIGSV
jgi:hypothetical protein